MKATANGLMKAYIFDMDGVIWDGDRAIPYAAERINRIVASGKPYIFMTNNAMRSREQYGEQLAEFGITTDIDHIINSSYAAALYIRDRAGPANVYALGNGELKKELESAGHLIVKDGADFVVNGLDLGINYEKLDAAYHNVKNGAELIACAPDMSYLENGVRRIGSGAFAKLIEILSGKKAVVVGKPSRVIIDIALRILGAKAGDCMLVGDKLETDILAGKRAGMKTALVLTGESTREDVDNSEIKPDYVIEDLRELP